jgi:hypothetical protein
LIPVASLVVALVGTACAGSALPVRPGPSLPVYHPTGTLIMEVGHFDHHIVEVELPSMKSTRFETYEFSSFYGGSGVAPDGTLYALSTYFDNQFGSTSQLFAGKPGHGEAQPLGETLKQAWGFKLRGTTAAAFGCYKRYRTIYVMDVAGDRTWRPAAEGCSAALSPDGHQLAWVDHQAIWTKSLPDGTPEQVADLTTIPGLTAAGVTKVPDSFTTLEWGTPGVAVMVGQGTAFALVILRAGAQPLVVPLGSNEPGAMTWQPHGSLLAFGDFVTKSQSAEVRVVDARTGSVRQVAATENFGQFQWSPDGKVIAVVREEQVTSFVDLEGNQLGVADVGGGVDAWLP